MTTLEVRCCCQPQKVLGHVTVPEGLAKVGARLCVTVTAAVDMQPYWTERERDRPYKPAVFEKKTTYFPVDRFTDGARTGIAVKAEGYTAEQLVELLYAYNFIPADEALIPSGSKVMDLSVKLIEAHEDRVTTCSGCGARIIFLPTASGKSMPIDSHTVDPADQVFEWGRHTSHFQTCPKAKEFQRR